MSVVAHQCMSEERDVILGVPQGTVLAAVVSIIMISDKDKNLKKVYSGKQWRR